MTNENESSSDKIIGLSLSGYKIVQRIADSLVFLAVKEDLDNQVAVKIFYPDPYACNKEAILERLNSVARLDHKNIVKIYEVGEHEDFIYAIMEYVQGENLYDLMRRNPRLHWAAAAELAREIIKGLVAAHGVIHRSLHPDRILLSIGGQIKINFCNEGEISPSSEIVYYVAPELFLGQELEENSDVYSLGSIIFNIVTGRPPLAGKPPKEVAMKHREMAPVLPKYGVADVPHSLSLLISRSLCKDIKHRYNRCFELQAAINNFLLNDIGRYKLGLYKELLPKVVEISESGKAFTEAINIEKLKRKKLEEETDTSEILEEKTEEVLEEKQERQESNLNKSIKKLQSIKPFYVKILIISMISVFINIIFMILLRSS